MLLGNKGLYGASGGRAFDADTLAWQAGVIANGGVVSFNELQWGDELVFDLRVCGAYPLLDDYGLFTAENQTQALTSFKKRLLGTAVNSPVYTPSLGFVNDGVSTYENTSFKPATSLVAGTAAGFSLGIIELTEVNANRQALGTSNTGTRACSIIPRVSGNTSGSINSNSVSSPLTVATSIGLTLYQRGGPTTLEQWRNDTLVASTTTTTNNTTTLPPDDLLVGCFNSSLTPTNFRANTVGVWLMGGVFTAPQIAGMYLAFKKYLAKHGQVI